MANTLTLAQNIAIPNINRIRIGRVNDDEDHARMEVTVVFYNANLGPNFPYPGNFVMGIENGFVSTLTGTNPAATLMTDTISFVPVSGSSVTTAYTLCAAAFRTSKSALLQQLVSLGAIPSGSVG